MTVDRPIFIVGPPRCGTSLLYRCIGSHPRVGYFNRANRKYQNHPRLAYLLTRLRLYRDKPRESHRIWERFCRREEDDVLTAEEATPEMKAWFHGFIDRVLASRGATRFVAKLPSLSVRIPWLKALFPDALFVMCLRDWRAAVGSIVIKRRNDYPGGGWFGIMPPGWKVMEPAPPEIGAAWMFLKVNEMMEDEARRDPDRFHRVRYEGLCADPSEVMEEIARFCGLPWNEEAKAAFPGDIRPASDKWRRQGVPSPEMIEKIRAEHGDALERYEHPPPG